MSGALCNLPGGSPVNAKRVRKGSRLPPFQYLMGPVKPVLLNPPPRRAITDPEELRGVVLVPARLDEGGLDGADLLVLEDSCGFGRCPIGTGARNFLQNSWIAFDDIACRDRLEFPYVSRPGIVHEAREQFPWRWWAWLEKTAAVQRDKVIKEQGDVFSVMA